jgi:hypothetical protein
MYTIHDYLDDIEDWDDEDTETDPDYDEDDE